MRITRDETDDSYGLHNYMTREIAEQIKAWRCGEELCTWRGIAGLVFDKYVKTLTLIHGINHAQD